MLADQRGAAAVRVLLILVLLGGLAFAALAAFRIGPAPTIAIQPGLKGIGRRTPVTVEVDAGGRGLRGVEVAVVQGNLRQVLATKSYTPSPAWKVWGRSGQRDRLQVEVGRETVKGLKAGTATIEVAAERPGAWLRAPGRTTVTLDLPVRLNPPTLAPQSDAVYVAQGGSECVVYRVGESSVKDGVQAGEAFFPGYPLPGGGQGVKFVLFAVPYDLADVSQVRLTAEDEVGNRATAAFVHKFFPKRWHHSDIPLTDPFLQKVVPEIVSQSPDVEEKGSLLETYLAINRDLRKVNNAEIRGLAGKSRAQFLWSKPFLRMAAAPEAGFADHRTYTYQGRSVDFQVHLGVDMADTQNVAVPSANDGVVVLARYLGIYGNTVVVDHGYGLMTLYGHLSSIGVKEGEQVKRAQELGRSGATGLAGGDHLHYSVLVDGTFVIPKEWWDPHWIQDRIARKLPGAFKLES
ncbi:MAG TPA: M23 family metallopeptidase [Candidatus Polarisedimenticolaceae bacterium]|nr:M23 family metallopeptidase [Candidatus Polarisedimenticolaceae bacterium]